MNLYTSKLQVLQSWPATRCFDRAVGLLRMRTGQCMRPAPAATHVTVRTDEYEAGAYRVTHGHSLCRSLTHSRMLLVSSRFRMTPWLVAMCVCVLAGPQLGTAQSFLKLQTSNMFATSGTNQPWQVGAVQGGKLWAMFGGINCGTNYLQVGSSADNGVTWSYSTVSTTAFGTSFPIDSGVTTWQGNLVVAGGTTCGIGWFNNVWSSTDGANWISRTADWGGRAGLTLLVVQYPTPRMYMLGGSFSQRDVWYSSTPLQTANGGWTLQTAIAPWGSVGAAVVTDSNRILLTSTSIGPGVWISNVGVTSWTLIPGSSGAWFGTRSRASLVNVQGNLFLFAGQSIPSNVYQNDVWVSSDEGSTWLLVTAAAGFSPRARAEVVANGRAIILFGGSGAQMQEETDVWSGFV